MSHSDQSIPDSESIGPSPHQEKRCPTCGSDDPDAFRPGCQMHADSWHNTLPVPNPPQQQDEKERIFLYRYKDGATGWTVWPPTAGNPADAPQRADTEWIEVKPVCLQGELDRLAQPLEEATGKPFGECSHGELLEACRWFWMARDQ